ncbi:MAG: hypothetical protein A2504_17755 [Bdellovibrionales bacterium RIFOXYD12_FULL_39_22]|nr:MAG: hypothetical protein A2385_15455 [Bdellovibrionales bacterium RIFOXYB1_FULL_39_21]OFZ40596.1 MAG: hypothetical protein A2485_03310 [Bdellovibrionales bacterium RIFOXYC12_FULL_39_17]OFZ50456.1 MAG: hypothetical protein A2404_02755 [Bdellovibrionales bacterium RIFOXYC1_FULL_39_130]OFZ77715.1 MAG: hypothetical protein A2560_05125 [Bdellovibrionales bacterium RIFOXYD1_FULL_39_84]OFZ91749.1 MAG: hypothetical protein A2504_17755 [Bdellovibrionales bacterium RIFOXYD12_FULL_39_22]HLE12990.1 hy
MSLKTIFISAVYLLIVSCNRGPDNAGNDATPTPASSPTPTAATTAACGMADGICPAACTFYDDNDCVKCNSVVGLTAPVESCSAEWPCTNLLPTYPAQGIYEISTGSDIPSCQTQFPTAATIVGCVRGGRGAFNDGPPKNWIDEDGISRYWCEYRPSGTASNSKRPLLIYIPGSGSNADAIYDFTLLRAKAIDYDNLSGDSSRKGIILVSTQGRNLHWPTASTEEGSKHDSYHRNLATNRDVAFVDHIIDTLVAEGVVDPNRIYLTGWSNGARFATFYGISRHQTATAGGNKVAAVAVYSGGDPYENIATEQSPSCKQNPYPQTQLPFLVITRNCDAITCNQEHFDTFSAEGWIITPGNQVEAWFSTLQNTMNNSHAQWLKINYYGADTASCLALPICTRQTATRNHFCWPDGISDGGGVDREIDLLEFLKSNPR